jgi:hypothetical protein
VISEDFQFEGFDARDFLNLLSLFRGPGARGEPDPESFESVPPSGTLVLVLDDQGSPCAALNTSHGAIALPDYDGEADLAPLCERLGVQRAVVLAQGTIEELTERAAHRLRFDADYAAQWLTLFAVARELEAEGKLRFWPPRTNLPLPTANMLYRALDLLLPHDHVLMIVLWDGDALWTACALHRRGAQIDRVVGPKLLLDWTGPLGGDYRRDQRAIRRAVERALGPVHVGLFAQRDAIEELLRDPSPGAWARAVALREIIISPAPRYVHLAVGADAARAAGQRARQWFGGIDVAHYLGPAALFAREHVARIGSITQILGFNPLQALAARLRRRG